MKYLYLDCDDVLLDTTRVFMEFMYQDYGIIDDANKYPSDWDISASPFAGFADAVKAFAHSDYFKNIPPRPQADVGIKSLIEQGYRLFVVSSCPNDETSQKNRRQCLLKHFGDVFEDIVCLSFGMDNKGRYFSSAPYGIVIDDSIFNVNTALRCGHQAILMAIAQNGDFQRQARDKNITVSRSLLEVADYLANK